MPFYLLGYLAKAGRNYATETVDLTHGKTPIPHDNGYASRTYRFSEPETNRILAKARALDLSLHQYMCLAVAEAMLSAQPEKSRVCIAVPTDLARYSPDFPRTVPGNYTGTLICNCGAEHHCSRRSRDNSAGFAWALTTGSTGSSLPFPAASRGS